MLDVFILLAADQKLRGTNRRPLKIVYVSATSAPPPIMGDQTNNAIHLLHFVDVADAYMDFI